MPLPPVKPPTPAAPPGPAGKEEIIARTGQYEVASHKKGSWLVVGLRGTYADDMLDVLKKEIFNQKLSMAFDTSLLSGIQMQLARELWFTAGQLKNGDTR